MADTLTDRLATVAATRCPVCGGDGAIAIRDVVDHWFGVPGTWSFRSCDGCRSLWLDPRPTSDDLHRAYERYYTHGGARSGLTTARRLLRSMPSHRDDVAGDRGWLGHGPGRVLDVGCGDGRTLAALAEAGWDAEGIDLDPASIAACREAGLHARVATIDDVPADEVYDAAVAVHVVEHVETPAIWLEAICRRVRPGGQVHLVTPNALGTRSQLDGPLWRGLEAPRHLQVFSANGLRRLAESAGLEDVRIFTSARGTNGMIRAARSARRPVGSRSRSTAAVDLVAGEAGQAAAALRNWRRPLSGDELVMTGLTPGHRQGSARIDPSV